MSTDWYQDIIDFHKQVMNDSFPTYPHIPNSKYQELRKTLIKEEVDETIEAIDSNNLVELADGIVDSIVVLLGAAVTYGIDIRPIWNEIHKTNMAKKSGKIRADGKRLKPEGWKPPEVDKEIEKQQSKAFCGIADGDEED